MEQPWDFEYTDGDFRILRRLASSLSGICLSDEKKELVYGRLSKRLRHLGLTSFGNYCELLLGGNKRELVHFVNAITTNLTSFFREPHHFEYLSGTLLPQLLEHNARSRKIRIWSAGCSTGEEPYSIAMAIRERLPQRSGWQVEILATDIDSEVLAQAQTGIYREERVNGVSQERLKRWFRRGKAHNAGLAKVASEVRELISFRQLNLVQAWPMRGPYDVVFCRNVVIYFDKPTQRVLFDRFADLLTAGGHLFVGHSETLFKVCDRFEALGKTMYRKRL